MYLREVMEEKGFSQYRLSKETGISQSTISDILNEKTDLSKCSFDTVSKLSQVLNISIDELADNTIRQPKRIDFEIFKSNVCHIVKAKGYKQFIIDTLRSDEITTLYNRKWYPETFYLLAMLDYVSRRKSVPICTKYNYLRHQKLDNILFPGSVVIADLASNSDEYRIKALKKAIPEFLRFNIVEREINDVC